MTTIKRILNVTMEDGSVWTIPAELIARDRATYYHDEYGDNEDEEYELSLWSDSDLIDWAANNMTWEQIQPNLSLLTPPPLPDYKEAWNSATLTVETVY